VLIWINHIDGFSLQNLTRRRMLLSAISCTSGKLIAISADVWRPLPWSAQFPSPLTSLFIILIFCRMRGFSIGGITNMWRSAGSSKPEFPLVYGRKNRLHAMITRYFLTTSLLCGSRYKNVFCSLCSIVSRTRSAEDKRIHWARSYAPMGALPLIRHHWPLSSALWVVEW